MPVTRQQGRVRAEKFQQPPALGVRLQRACACGQHIPGGGECAECRKKRLATASPIVHEALYSPGHAKDTAVLPSTAPGFGHDFTRDSDPGSLYLSPKTNGEEILRQAGETGATPSPTEVAVSEEEIGADLQTARTWASNAARRMQSYARIVRFLAQEPNMSYRIGTTPLGRGQTQGLNCAILGQFQP